MADEQLKTGDVVELKSGGPGMTVESVGTRNVMCTWFDGKSKNSAAFNPNALRKIS